MRELLFKNKRMMIKYCNKYGTLFSIQPQGQEGRHITIYFYDDKIDAKQAEQIAPILEKIFDRVYIVASADGYHAGEETAIKKIQNQFKKLLGI